MRSLSPAYAAIRDAAFGEAGALWMLDPMQREVVRVGPR